MARSRQLGILAALALACVASCFGGSPSAPPVAAFRNVTFVYASAVPVGLPPHPMSTGCVHHYSAFGGTHVVRGSWGGGTSVRSPIGDCTEGCAFPPESVPTGQEHVVHLIDLGLCDVDPTVPPFAYSAIWANGVLLTRFLDNHPSGMHGVAFTVLADGTIIP